jgi:hypothetical protein
MLISALNFILLYSEDCIALYIDSKDYGNDENSYGSSSDAEQW